MAQKEAFHYPAFRAVKYMTEDKQTKATTIWYFHDDVSFYSASTDSSSPKVEKNLPISLFQWFIPDGKILFLRLTQI